LTDPVEDGIIKVVGNYTVKLRSSRRSLKPASLSHAKHAKGAEFYKEENQQYEMDVTTIAFTAPGFDCKLQSLITGNCNSS
jgi:hypothetical protein